jgi:hypothetical protein
MIKKRQQPFYGWLIVLVCAIGLFLGAPLMVSSFSVFFTAYGHAFGAFMIAGAAGVTLMGAGYDHYHSYAVPLAGLCGAMILFLVLLTRLGPYGFGVAEQQTVLPVEPVQVPSGS